MTITPGKSDYLLPLGQLQEMLMHLLLGLSDSQAGEKSRLLTRAGKHMILVRAYLADNCVMPGLPRLAGEP